MKIFLSLRVTADAEGGLKGPARPRRSLRGLGAAATNKRASVYTGALLATMVKAPKEWRVSALFSGSYPSYNGRESA